MSLDPDGAGQGGFAGLWRWMAPGVQGYADYRLEVSGERLTAKCLRTVSFNEGRLSTGACSFETRPNEFQGTISGGTFRGTWTDPGVPAVHCPIESMVHLIGGSLIEEGRVLQINYSYALTVDLPNKCGRSEHIWLRERWMKMK